MSMGAHAELTGVPANQAQAPVCVWRDAGSLTPFVTKPEGFSFFTIELFSRIVR